MNSKQIFTIIAIAIVSAVVVVIVLRLLGSDNAIATGGGVAGAIAGAVAGIIATRKSAAT
jgi:ribulose 1,5-bisphosphate carboxylase large subunit-like protein